MMEELGRNLLILLPLFCFAYPFVMAWYWMAGGLFYYLWRERGFNRPEDPPMLDQWPPFSVLVPCYNESGNAIETLTAACTMDYPGFEVVAINDGSRDDTAEILDRLSDTLPNLRVIHLAENGGKANALNIGALLARHELLLCIDGDALLDPQALRWAAYNFQRTDVGAITGNPRIRNRSTLLGKLQVGEFSSIVGLIKRAQTGYGSLFTVSGVIAGFRRAALAEAGWWSSHTLTDDIDVTWRIQMAGWRVAYAPSVLVWILMPETLGGLWKQRVRWAEGGVQMMLDYFWPMVMLKQPRLMLIYANYLLSILRRPDPGGGHAGLAEPVDRGWCFAASKLVGGGAGRYLSGAGDRQPSGGAPVRGGHGAFAVLDRLVSDCLLGDCHPVHPARHPQGAVPAEGFGARHLGKPRPGVSMTGVPSRAEAEWPPIIRSSKVGRAVLVRDLVLTILMWGILCIILYTELAFALESLAVLLGRSEAQIDAELALFWRRMQPLIWLIGVLVAMLGIATLASIRRRNRALKSPPPPPLPKEAIAALAGLTAAEIEAIQAMPRAVIRRVEGQGLVVETGSAPGPS